MVVEACGHGLARHVVDLTAGLLERGWRVGLVYSTTRPTDGTLETMLLRLRHDPNFRAFSCAMSLWPSLSDIGIVREILRAISMVQAGVVHCHSTKAGFVGRIAAKIAGVPSLYTPHGLLCVDPGLAAPLRVTSGYYEAIFGRLSSRFIALSEEEKACALRLGVPLKRICLVPNGIPLPPPPTAEFRTRMRERFGLEPGTIGVGFVGRLVTQKAIDNLLHAWKVLLDRGRTPRAKLLMVGDGPLRSGLEALSRSLGLAGTVIWAGQQPGPESMAAFDLFVLASDCEAMGYVLLEAMAIGLPIVTTDTGGGRMIVGDGLYARVVPRREPEKLALALEEIAGSAELRDTMGAASRGRVSDFTADRMIDSLTGIYKSLLRTGAPDQPLAGAIG
jgi:glycosyltransferase involved in cell wall biosynthesis